MTGSAGGSSAPGASPDGLPPGDRPARRGRRRAVRPGAGEPDPLVDLRAADDSDLGWHEPVVTDGDDRLLRDVPPHW